MTPGSQFYAHTAPDPSVSWQLLEDHLTGVGQRAAAFASEFGASDWGHLAGLWHDIGKYSNAFQAYLREAGDVDVHASDELPRIDHSTAGAQHAVGRFGGLGHLLAYPIAGHHSGLLDAISETACLDARLKKGVEDWSANAPQDLLAHSLPDLPESLRSALGAKDAYSAAFFVRMLFSCLVDADFLDTAAFLAPEREVHRPRWPADIIERMDAALAQRLGEFGTPRTPVECRRAEVLTACQSAAGRRPGLFTLTVPTGGGKTLSSLAFALRHASNHGLKRVIYVAPFTSIIEQNADVFRAALDHPPLDGGPDPVVEHHTGLDPEAETVWSRLAAENWDAPLVVTTAVQFYESLFANRSSRCRKLHNLARSVVILDEAQCLPVDYLAPCLRALRELTTTYGTTVLLCTATQPAVGSRQDLPIGLDLTADREIIDDPPALFNALRRVRVSRHGRMEDEDLAQRLNEHEQVLCIVNTRRHARELFERVRQRGDAFHLSASMCAQHRTQRIAEIRGRLDAAEPCLVVSTQVIEAGVDIDFPVVYRSLAGVDAIAQAAGRCNRHGLRARGQTIVFESEHPASERFLSDTAGAARQVLAVHDDVLALGAIEHYFRLYYWEQSHRWDRRGILDGFTLNGADPALPFVFNFATAARDFRLIEDLGTGVIVPWGERGRELCQSLRSAWPGPTRELLRRLQRYTVQVPKRTFFAEARAFEMVHDQYPVLAFPEAHYSDDVGLDLTKPMGQLLVS